MLSVQSVNLMSQPAFGKRDNSQFEDAEIVGAKPRKKRTISPEQQEKMRLARAEAKRAREEQKAYDEAVDQWQGIHDNLESLEDMVPEKIRKPYKAFRVASGAVITGLGVVWASKQSGKATKTALTSDFAKKAARVAGSTFDKVKKPFVTLYNNVAESAGKKLSGTRIEKAFNNAKNGVLENKVVKYVSEQAANAKRYASSKVSGINFEKVNNVTAGVLGTGSGLAAGYEVARSDA